jgi:hypothetical protein
MEVIFAAMQAGRDTVFEVSALIESAEAMGEVLAGTFLLQPARTSMNIKSNRKSLMSKEKFYRAS